MKPSLIYLPGRFELLFSLSPMVHFCSWGFGCKDKFLGKNHNSSSDINIS